MNKIFTALIFALLFASQSMAMNWIDSNLYGEVKSADYKPSLKDDFYVAVNYDWLVNTKLKPGYSRAAAFTELQDILDERVKSLMTDDSLKTHDAALIQKLYSQWLDWEQRNKNGLADLPELSQKILAVKTIDELSEFFKTDDSFYNDIIIADFGLELNQKNSELYTLVLYAGSLSLGDSAEYRKMTPNGERTKKMSDSIVRFMLKRLNHDDKFIEEMLERSFRFETKISASMMTLEELYSPEAIEKTYNPITVDELREKSKIFPFAEVLESFNIRSNLMNLDEPKWLNTLNELYNSENLDDIKAYLLCKLVKRYMTLTDEKSYREYQRLSRERLGISGSKPDDELATDFVHSMLAVPVSKLYCERYIGENVKREITEIIQDTVKFYRNMLASEEWLSESTRSKAIEKLDAMKLKVAYPDKWVDYDGLELSDNFYSSVKNIRKYKLQKYFYDRINTKVDYDLWIDDVVVANSYYSPSKNSINIIAGILGGEFYSPEMSYEDKLGGVGFVIGHEISHAFDTRGSQFDKSGNVVSWWTKEDLAEFKAKADKLIKYLNSFIIEGQNYNGSLVQTETIADMAGAKAMLGIAESHENFDYDKFFRRCAKVWKLLQTKERTDSVLKNDVHALPLLRVNAVLQQFEKFHETYGITSNDKMYLAPDDRVAVW